MEARLENGAQQLATMQHETSQTRTALDRLRDRILTLVQSLADTVTGFGIEVRMQLSAIPRETVPQPEVQ